MNELKDIPTRRKIVSALRKTYNQVYDETLKVLRQEYTLNKLDAFNPSGGSIIQWTEAAAKRLGIDLEYLNEEYSERKQRGELDEHPEIAVREIKGRVRVSKKDKKPARKVRDIVDVIEAAAKRQTVSQIAI